MSKKSTLDCSLKCEINGELYNYRIVKCDKNTGIVELAKVGVKKPKPKYATIEMLNELKNEIEYNFNYKFDKFSDELNDLKELIRELVKKVG
jgi:hypothetical protein